MERINATALDIIIDHAEAQLAQFEQFRTNTDDTSQRELWEKSSRRWRVIAETLIGSIDRISEDLGRQLGEVENEIRVFAQSEDPALLNILEARKNALSIVLGVVNPRELFYGVMN